MIKEFLFSCNFLDSNNFRFNQPSSVRVFISITIVIVYLAFMLIMIGKDYSERGLTALFVKEDSEVSKESYEDFTKAGKFKIYSNTEIPGLCDLVVEYSYDQNEYSLSSSNDAKALVLKDFIIESKGNKDYYRYYIKNKAEDPIPPYSIDSGLLDISAIDEIQLIQFDVKLKCQNEELKSFNSILSEIELYVELRSISNVDYFNRKTPITESFRNRMIHFYSGGTPSAQKFNIFIDVRAISILNDDSYVNFESTSGESMMSGKSAHRALIIKDLVLSNSKENLELGSEVQDIFNTGVIRYSLNTTEDIILRVYSKLNQILPLYLCLFFAIIYVFKLAFIFGESYSKYLEYINSLYSLETDQSEESQFEYQEEFKRANDKLEDNNQASLLMNHQNERLGPDKFRKFSIRPDGTSIINRYTATSKTNKGKSVIDATFIRSSFVPNLNEANNVIKTFMPTSPKDKKVSAALIC